ncbi:MAG: metallophosphoesterase family protein, partial [Phycisphaerales bacterium JB038]
MPTTCIILRGCSCLLLALVIGCTPTSDQPVADSPSAAVPAAPEPLLVGTPGRSLPLPPQRFESLRLALLPDRTAGQPWGLPYLERAVADLARTQPDAIVGVGDMVQGYTRSVPRFRQEVAEFQNVLAGVDIPFYPTPGNHDLVAGSRQAGDDTFVSLYEEAFGPRYYAVDFGLAYIVVLSTEDLRASGGSPDFSAEQLAFLDRALATGIERQRPIFVFMHRPAWRSRGSNFLSDVHPRLVAAGVQAVIAGHFHSLQRDPDRDGVEYHILGVCGGMIDQHPLTGQLHHVSYLTVHLDGRFELYHSPVGHTLPDDWILSEDQNRA